MEQAKKLAKKYPLIKNDFAELAKQLSKNPTSGHDPMGKDCYKVRMEITGKPKGKSGGAKLSLKLRSLTKKYTYFQFTIKLTREQFLKKNLKEF